jgi:hypothetical protein
VFFKKRIYLIGSLPPKHFYSFKSAAVTDGSDLGGLTLNLLYGMNLLVFKFFGLIEVVNFLNVFNFLLSYNETYF